MTIVVPDVVPDVTPLPPQVRDVEMKTRSWPEHAEKVQVVDQRTFEMAAEDLKAIAQLKAEVVDVFGPIKKASWTAHKTNLEQEQKVLGPLEKADQIIRPKVAAYLAEQERIAKQQEEDRLAEARAAAQRQKEAELQALSDQGGVSVEEYVAVAEEPLPLVMSAPAPMPIKPAGIGTTEGKWKGRVADLAKFVAFVAANPQYLRLLEVNQSALNALAHSMKGALKLEGIEFYQETPGIRVSKKGRS